MRWSGGCVWDCLLWRQLSAVQVGSWLDGHHFPATPDGPAVMGASQAAIREAVAPEGRWLWSGRGAGW
jgi:hypothetical protein